MEDQWDLIQDHRVHTRSVRRSIGLTRLEGQHWKVFQRAQHGPDLIKARYPSINFISIPIVPLLLIFNRLTLSLSSSSSVNIMLSTTTSTAECQKVVPAILSLTDSLIALLNATSNRSSHTNQTISSLRSLLLRERKTIQRQNCIIANLRQQLSGVESQLCAVQQSLSCNFSNASEERLKVEEEDKVDLEVISDVQGEQKSREEELSAQAAASTLYDLQNIYQRMAERYAAGLRKREVDEESDWTEDS